MSKDVLFSYTPYRICPLGAHVDHQHGLITGFAIDRGVKIEYNVTSDGSVRMLSKNYGGVAEFNVSELPERAYSWVDFIVGSIMALQTKYEINNGIDGVVEGTLPVGGLSSSAAVLLSYIQAFAKANNIHLTRQELVKYALWAEHNYIGVNVGKLDQSCEVYCKENHLLYLDTMDDSIEQIACKNSMKPFDIMIAFSGVERKLAGSAYNARVDECKAAAYALKAYAGMEYGKFEEAYLRDIPEEVFREYELQLPENWRKRAEHFYSENRRVKKGVSAWKKGDIEAFGQLVFESGRSSIELYETGSNELKTMYDIMSRCDGIYGGRFSGAGFNGCSIALVDPDKREEVADFVKREYLKAFPRLEKGFSIHFCKSADGVRLE